MIRLVNYVPEVKEPRAEWIRLRSTFECYREDALFWEQNNGQAFISCLDGDMTVYNASADIDELAEFISVISPASIFTDEQTLLKLGKEPLEISYVFAKTSDIMGNTPSEEPNSTAVYRLFSAAGLQVPPYEYFAVDFCRRINRGFADCFLSKFAAAFAVHSGEYALLQGVASLEKGGGRTAVRAILQKNFGRTVLACCRTEICGFYEKNGFKELYKTAQWVKEI